MSADDSKSVVVNRVKTGENLVNGKPNKIVCNAYKYDVLSKSASVISLNDIFNLGRDNVVLSSSDATVTPLGEYSDLEIRVIAECWRRCSDEEFNKFNK